jgi:hypothetical protein
VDGWLQDLMDQVSVATRRVMPRVDDLVRTMYVCTRGGVQAPLLEARAAALVMASAALVAAFRAAYSRATAVDVQWLVLALSEMDGHLEALRLVSQHEEMALLEKVQVVMEAPLEEDEENDEPGTSAMNVPPPAAAADDDCPADPSTANIAQPNIAKTAPTEQTEEADATTCLTTNV